MPDRRHLLKEHPDWVLLKDVGTLLESDPAGGNETAHAPGSKGIGSGDLEMTHARRRREAGKARKGILRRMKLLLKKIEGHALRHRDLLEAMWMQSDYTEKKASRIIERMDGRADTAGHETGARTDHRGAAGEE